MAVAVSISPRNRMTSQVARFFTMVTNGVSIYGRSRALGSTAPIRNVRSVSSSNSTSITSSTVTNPTTRSSVSSTGTANRLYLLILNAASFWLWYAPTLTGLRCITESIQAVAAFLQYVTGVNSLLVGRIGLDRPQRFFHGHCRPQPYEFRGHYSAGSARRVVKQLFDFALNLLTGFWHDLVLLVRTHASYDRGALVRRHAFKYFCGNCRVKLLKDRRTSPQSGLVAHAN